MHVNRERHTAPSWSQIGHEQYMHTTGTYVALSQLTDAATGNLPLCSSEACTQAQLWTSVMTAILDSHMQGFMRRPTQNEKWPAVKYLSMRVVVRTVHAFLHAAQQSS